MLETALSGLVNTMSWKVLVGFSPNVTYTCDVLSDRDERLKFWDQKVNVQGHGGVIYAGTITVQCTGGSIQYLMSRVKLGFLVSIFICPPLAASKHPKTKILHKVSAHCSTLALLCCWAGSTIFCYKNDFPRQDLAFYSILRYDHNCVMIYSSSVTILIQGH